MTVTVRVKLSIRHWFLVATAILLLAGGLAAIMALDASTSEGLAGGSAHELVGE